MWFCIVGALFCSPPYNPPTAWQYAAYSVIVVQPQQPPLPTQIAGVLVRF